MNAKLHLKQSILCINKNNRIIVLHETKYNMSQTGSINLTTTK